MPLSDTIARLAALRAQGTGGAPPSDGSLRELRDFGTNPGNLSAWFHLPEGMSEGAALVVVLHGCTQDAASYNRHSGWSALADEQGFALLYAEQRRANNPNLCFNWFEPGDSRRGAGEPLSIIQMIEALATAHALDRSRIFVTGLSAGGAMSSTLLATYPEVFAGGAIIAGLPYGAAASIPQALERMRGQGLPAKAALADAITAASPHTGPWPRISIWHGTADHVVAPSNADAILGQWQAKHGVDRAADHSGMVGAHAHRTWLGADGTVMIEDYRVAGMGHGTPLAAAGPDACGQPGPHMLEAGLSSTRRIAQFWGLSRAKSRRRSTAVPVLDTAHAGALPDEEVATVQLLPPIATATPPRRARPSAPSRPGVGRIIEDALRAAGLMR